MYYSQLDQKWKKNFLGNSQMTIGGYGCFLTSLLNLCRSEMNPLELNELAIKNNGFSSHGLLYSARIAKLLNMEVIWNNKSLNHSKPHPEYDCIAITDKFKSRGIPQHFFVLLKTGEIVDPLDINPAPKENPYKIIAYRHFDGAPTTLYAKPKRKLNKHKDIEEKINTNSEIYNFASEIVAKGHEIMAKTHTENEQYRKMLDII